MRELMFSARRRGGRPWHTGPGRRIRRMGGPIGGGRFRARVTGSQVSPPSCAQPGYRASGGRVERGRPRGVAQWLGVVKLRRRRSAAVGDEDPAVLQRRCRVQLADVLHGTGGESGVGGRVAHLRRPQCAAAAANGRGRSRGTGRGRSSTGPQCGCLRALVERDADSPGGPVEQFRPVHGVIGVRPGGAVGADVWQRGVTRAARCGGGLWPSRRVGEGRGGQVAARGSAEGAPAFCGFRA